MLVTPGTDAEDRADLALATDPSGAAQRLDAEHQHREAAQHAEHEHAEAEAEREIGVGGGAGAQSGLYGDVPYGGGGPYGGGARTAAAVRRGPSR